MYPGMHVGMHVMYACMLEDVCVCVCDTDV